MDECSSYPFDGGIGATPCEEEDGESLTCGNYQVTIAVYRLPEPAVILQLFSGGIGLAWLNRRRNRRMTRSSQDRDDTDRKLDSQWEKAQDESIHNVVLQSNGVRIGNWVNGSSFRGPDS